MLATWLLLTLILAPLLALALAGLLMMQRARRLYTRKYFWCPLKKLFVNVTFLADPTQGDHYYDVMSCSAFEYPTQVTCDKRCLELPEAKTASAPYIGARRSKSSSRVP